MREGINDVIVRGGREEEGGADTELKTKNPHVNVGNKTTGV